MVSQHANSQSPATKSGRSTQWSIDYTKNDAMNVPGKPRETRNAFVTAALAAVETCLKLRKNSLFTITANIALITN